MPTAQVSSNKLKSGLVRAFAARAGKLPGQTPEQIMEALIECHLHKKTRTLDERIQLFLMARKVHTVEEKADLDGDGVIEPLGNCYEAGFRIRINATSTLVRRRFTLAHEACHSIFYEVVPELKFVPHMPDEEEERLCNLGAAALLIPADTLRKKVEGVAPCLDFLFDLASVYTVSIQTLLLRLRGLGLWTAELSMWHRMGNGAFVLDKLYGGRRIDWEWTDEEVLNSAWQRKDSLRGHTFIRYQDLKGVKRFKPVAYEVRRKSDGLVALWGKGLARKKSSTSKSLF